jgi:hypothetical protein
MSNSSYGKLTSGLIAAWFAFAITAAAMHLFVGQPGRPPIAVGLAAVVPVMLFLGWFAGSVGFRRFVLGLNARALTYVQTWRVNGFIFLVLYSAGLLPGFFALPAGWGDIAIGATAPLGAMLIGRGMNGRGYRRGGFIAWQMLGMLDLVLAVTLGATAGMLHPHDVQPGIMAFLPMSLIPTFAVPLLMILHVICIAQAREWKTA